MKITLRNFKYSPSLSEETNAFTADVYASGKKMAYARNSGTGGQTLVSPLDRALLTEAESYCATLPDRHGCKTTVEDLVDDLAQELINVIEINKVIKKLDRLAINNVVVVNKAQFDDFKSGKSVSLKYSHLKLVKPARQYTPDEKKAVNARLQLKDGESIYNTAW